MDILDIFLKKHSYKFDKGYLDMSNEQDISLLEQIFESMGLSEAFRNLNFFELNKRGGGRFKILADKIKNKLPFNLSNGESTPLEFIDDKAREAFENADSEKIKQFSRNINIFKFFKDDGGNEYSLSDLLKDKDFGGKGAGSGTKVEDHNLKLLNDLIVEKGKPINVIVNGKEYKNIIGARTQSGMPKSDFFLINEKEEPVIHISHKKSGGKGPSANDFIRWSGYTMYESHPEVKEFNEALKKWLEENNLDGLPNSTRFISPIKDEDLIRKLIYGSDYGKDHGKDHVNCILQGKISLNPKGENTYELESEHSLFSPEIPEGEYYPYLTASYRGDRRMFDIKNNEAIVMTKKGANGSSNIYELNNVKFEKVK